MGHARDSVFRPANAAVLTVSDTRTEATDTSGRYIAEQLSQAGHRVTEKAIVADDLSAIRAKVREFLDGKRCQYIIVTGGTGLSSRDVTPEAVAPLYTKRVPGFGELFRALSYKEIGVSTMQSRAEAGLCGHALVFLLPGSTNACRLGMTELILPQIDNTHGPCNFRDILPDAPEA